MQFSLWKLLLTVTLAGITFAVIRSISFVGPLCLTLSAVLFFGSVIAYPIAVLTSPQKGMRLDPGANPVIQFINRVFVVAALLLAFFIGYVFFVASPLRYW